MAQRHDGGDENEGEKSGERKETSAGTATAPSNRAAGSGGGGGGGGRGRGRGEESLENGKEKKGKGSSIAAWIPCALFSASSISMILLNKAVMRVYPLPSVLLVMQVGALGCSVLGAGSRAWRARHGIGVWMFLTDSPREGLGIRD